MGKEKTTQESSSTETRTRTPEQAELDRLDLELRRSTQGGLMQTQQQGLSLINQLLMGQALPGYLGGLPGGITPELTREMSTEAIRDLTPSLQQGGLIDSGVAASVAARTAGDIRRQSAQFNLQNLMQLLNIAVGGQAQVQSPIIGQAGALGSRLAQFGTTTGSQQTTLTQMNPFWKSFQTGLGSALGGALVPNVRLPFGSSGGYVGFGG